MFRYDPEAREVTEPGPNPTNSQSVWELESSPDGSKIYGATYPDSKVFEFDVESDTFRDLGTMMEGQVNTIADIQVYGGKLLIRSGSSTLISLINRLEAAGEVKPSLKEQLVNTLETAKHHKDSGRAKQASKHYEKFLNMLNNSKEQDISASAKEQLLAIAAVIAPKYGL